jgi:hypothetical protein
MGPQGPQGDVGPAGPPGPQGEPGLANVEIVTVKTTSSSTRNKNLVASCPAGKVVIGGGARVIRNDANAWEDVALVESYPSGSNQWSAVAAEGTETALLWQLEVRAICATVAQ